MNQKQLKGVYVNAFTRNHKKEASLIYLHLTRSCYNKKMKRRSTLKMTSAWAPIHHRRIPPIIAQSSLVSRSFGGDVPQPRAACYRYVGSFATRHVTSDDKLQPSSFSWASSTPRNNLLYINDFYARIPSLPSSWRPTKLLPLSWTSKHSQPPH